MPSVPASSKKKKKQNKTELEKDCGKGTLLEQSALPLFIQIETG